MRRSGLRQFAVAIAIAGAGAAHDACLRGVVVVGVVNIV